MGRLVLAAIAALTIASPCLAQGFFFPVYWQKSVADFASLPACDGGDEGRLRMTLDTGHIYACESSAWVLKNDAGAGGGDISAVGDCSTGDCFQAVTGRHALLGPAAGGVAVFRAITEADVSDLSHATSLDASAITYTPADGTDWIDPDPGDSGTALDDLAARITDDEAALPTHAGNASAHHTKTVDASELTAGTLADARISESSVTQHEAAIDHDGLSNYVAAEHVPTRQAATDCTAETGGVTGEVCYELDDDALYVCESGPCEGAGWVEYGGGSGGAPAFSDITSGTNTAAAMVVGAGASLAKASTGTIDASAIDHDGDGSREISVNSGNIDLDGDGSGVGSVLRIRQSGSSTIYIEAIAGNVSTRLRSFGSGASILQSSFGPVVTADSSGGTTMAGKATVSDLLKITPKATAPATCTAATDIYTDTSGALCFCTSTNTWTNTSGVGLCV